MNIKFHELLLSELRMAVYQPGNPERLTDELLCKAVTLNENLQSLGYVLRPDDLVKIAVSPSMDSFFRHVKSLIPDVKAEPMYPGFPQQVMEMSEAEFRMHQVIHYFSTYGLEELFGGEVNRGWLPEYQGPARVQDDTSLMNSRVIELVSEENAAGTALRMILSRRERLTNPELELATVAASRCDAGQLEGIIIRFKENLDLLFPRLMTLEDRDVALEILCSICAHSGDVMRCAAAYLREKRWHLSTSEKKLLVKLLERYSTWNFRENLMQSIHKREQNLRILQHLDYNRFSASREHREIVRALRNDELMSWHGVGEKLLREDDPGTLTHLAERPGYMLRMLNRLLSLEYGEEQILAVMTPKAGRLSGHLILKTLRTLSARSAKIEEIRLQELRECDTRFDREESRLNPETLKWEFEWRRNNVRWTAEEKRQNAKYSFLDEPGGKLEQQAFEEVNVLSGEMENASDRLAHLESILHRGEAYRNRKNHYEIRNAVSAIDKEAVLYLLDPEETLAKLRNAEAELRNAEAEFAALSDQRDQAQERAEKWLDRELRVLNIRNGLLYSDAIDKIDLWEQQELEHLRKLYEQNLSTQNLKQEFERLRTMREKEHAEIEARYRQRLHSASYDSASVRILRTLLKEHFRMASTPLKGKKVFCSLDQFDLSHSCLETEDRSKDGGYVRSGISWRIPEEAKYVRFFVYWNDERRVDVDLHAGGVTTDGRNLHVGWNSDFRDSGVVHSGDITHSDAAEYIDIDLSAPVKEIYANVNLFSGRPSFKAVETCYVGLMAVDRAKQDVKHYNPKNCFFTHRLSQNTTNLFYGIIDVQNRFVRFIGQPNSNGWAARPDLEDAERMFSLQDYLDCLLEAQDAKPVDSESEAEVVLTMEKGLSDKSISLVDHNFFLEC